MADKKVTQLPALVTPAAPDLLLIIDDPNGTPVTKKISLKTFFGAVPANTTISGNLLPGANNTYSIGSSTSQWRSLYVSNNTIYIGGKSLTIANSGALIVNGSVVGNVSAQIGNIRFSGYTITTEANNQDIHIIPKGTGSVHLSQSVFEEFDTTDVAVWFRDANTAGQYSGIGNSSIYLDVATFKNEDGSFVIKGDGRFKYKTNDAIAVANTEYGHVVIRTENNDKYIKVYNSTESLGIELRTDQYRIEIGPNNYVWSFRPQGQLIVPSGGSIKFNNNTSISAIRGPYVNDAAAASGGVALKSLYYDASGNVKIRLA
jgi:hypothetical protein